MTTRALIVEDEVPATQRLSDLIAEVAWLECIGHAPDGAAAIRMIDAERPDLVFLDISMPGASGLEVLEQVTHSPAVIFTTANDQYAIAAFELQAIDYLMKPFTRERFLTAVERARRTLTMPLTPPAVPVTARARTAVTESADARSTLLTRLFVRDHSKIVPVAVREIERLEAQDDYVALFTGGHRYLVYLPLGEFERRLDSAHFIRVHRSHIVNVDFVDHFEPFEAGRLLVVMRGGTRILASRVRSSELRHLAV
ncbi:MAG: LytTR family DNA-binding domain-containing protein [Gemmatimonadota bacterium]|nr:LytTR family DNA-binding domain-containing protein [Gemmatimonadota bacterium]